MNKFQLPPVLYTDNDVRAHILKEVARLKEHNEPLIRSRMRKIGCNRRFLRILNEMIVAGQAEVSFSGSSVCRAQPPQPKPVAPKRKIKLPRRYSPKVWKSAMGIDRSVIVDSLRAYERVRNGRDK